MSVLTEIRSEIVTAVGFNRVWELRLPQLTQLPEITYHQFGDSPDYLLDASEYRSVMSLQIDIWSNTLSEAKSISEYVRTALSGFSSSTIHVMLLDDVSELYEREEGSDSVLWHYVHQYTVYVA